MKQILATTDFSNRSERALRRAGLLAQEHDAELTLVYVVDDDRPSLMVELDRWEAERYLNEQFNQLPELSGARGSVEIVDGDAFDGILRTAQSCSADLIVMGAHRKQLLQDIVIGTTIERVIRSGPYPVLMVNNEVTHPYRQVLVAIDASEASARAIKTSKTLGMLDGIHLTIVHAYSTVARQRMFVADVSQQQIAGSLDEERLRATRDLMSFLKANECSDQRWSYHLEEGPPFDVISRVVKDLTPDVLVLGTHGRTGIAKFFIGSVSEQCLRSLRIDILAVPPIR